MKHVIELVRSTGLDGQEIETLYLKTIGTPLCRVKRYERLPRLTEGPTHIDRELAWKCV